MSNNLVFIFIDAEMNDEKWVDSFLLFSQKQIYFQIKISVKFPSFR